MKKEQFQKELEKLLNQLDTLNTLQVCKNELNRYERGHAAT